MVHHQQVPHVRSSMKQVGEQVVLREARQLTAIKAGLKGIGLPNERQLLPLLLAACRAAVDISLDALLTAVPWLRLVVSDQPMTIALLFEHATSEEMAASSRNDMYLSFLSKKEGLRITNTDTGGLRRLDNLRDDLLQDAGWREVRTAMDDLLEDCKRYFLAAMSYSGHSGSASEHDDLSKADSELSLMELIRRFNRATATEDQDQEPELQWAETSYQLEWMMRLRHQMARRAKKGSQENLYGVTNLVVKVRGGTSVTKHAGPSCRATPRYKVMHCARRHWLAENAISVFVDWDAFTKNSRKIQSLFGTAQIPNRNAEARALGFVVEDGRGTTLSCKMSLQAKGETCT